MTSPRSHTSTPRLGALAKTAVTAALEHGAGRVSPQEILTAVDATCGNGHDTLFLAQTLRRLRPENSLVVAFDLQPTALRTARERLDADAPPLSARFAAKSHETPSADLPPHSALYAAMYNLGFLPGSDKTIATRPDTTLRSLRDILAHLRPGGVCAVHAYGGHAGGAEELLAVEAFFAELPFDALCVARYALCNKPRNPETLFLAEKR